MSDQVASSLETEPKEAALFLITGHLWVLLSLWILNVTLRPRRHGLLVESFLLIVWTAAFCALADIFTGSQRETEDRQVARARSMSFFIGANIAYFLMFRADARDTKGRKTMLQDFLMNYHIIIDIWCLMFVLLGSEGVVEALSEEPTEINVEYETSIKAWLVILTGNLSLLVAFLVFPVLLPRKWQNVDYYISIAILVMSYALDAFLLLPFIRARFGLKHLNVWGYQLTFELSKLELGGLAAFTATFVDISRYSRSLVFFSSGSIIFSIRSFVRNYFVLLQCP